LPEVVVIEIETANSEPLSGSPAAANKSEVRALEYRARADAAEAAAAGCVLEQPRRQHELAAKRWREMAEAEEGRTARSRIYLGPAR
jgi:hypothetical protein